MTSSAIEILRTLSRPSVLDCSAVDGLLLRDRLRLESCHSFAQAAPESDVANLAGEELQELLRIHNGIQLFDGSCYANGRATVGLWVLGSGNLAQRKLLFEQVLDQNIALCADDWKTAETDSGRELIKWAKALTPFALPGNTGDLLVLDFSAGAATVGYLEHQTYAAGPFDQREFAASWTSIAEMMTWYADTLLDRLADWRFYDMRGNQYAIDAVEFAS